MYTQEDADNEYKKFVDRIDSIKAMSNNIEVAHEDSLNFLRIDMKKISATLFTDSEGAARKDNIRLSWTGMILATCARPHYDDWMESKKQIMTPGRIFLFNPETAYSLNIEGMYEIWTLSLQNVMSFRNDIDIFKMYRETLQKRVEIFSNRP